MLLYNQRKEFVGIDSDDLNALGFANINELLSESNDFADLFVKKPGYIHNFKNFSWIDFILHSETGESKAIIHAKGKNYSCLLHVSGFHYISDESGFAVLIKNIRQLTGAEDAQASKSVDVSGGVQASAVVPPSTPPVAEIVPEPSPEPVVSPIAEKEEPEYTKPSLDISLEDMLLDKPSEETFSVEEPELPRFDDGQELSEPDLLDIPESPELETAYATENEFGAPVDLGAPLDIEDNLSLDFEEPAEEELPIITEEEDLLKDETPMLGDYVTAPADSEHLSELITSGTYQYNPQVAADELGLPVDLIEEFIGDFIDQAHEFHDDLFASVNGDDFDNVQILSHKLKGVAANLRVEDAFDTLSVVNTSKDKEEVLPNLNQFYKIIAKLEGKEVDEPAPAAAAPVPEPEPVVEAEPEPELNIGIKQPDEGPMLIDEDVPAIDDDDLYNDLLAEPEPIAEIEEPPSFSTEESFNDDDDLYDDLLASSSTPAEAEEIPAAPVEPEFEDDIYGDLLGTPEESFSAPETTPEVVPEMTPEVASEPEIEVPNLNFDSQRAANELGIPVDIVNDFVQDFKEQVSSHKADFNTAIAEGDIQGVKKTATLLKGMSDNLRLNEISEVLKGLQQISDINNTEHELKTLEAYADQL